MTSTLLSPTESLRSARRVLAIEPNPARARILRASLESAGVDLEIVPSSEDAIRSMSGTVPQLVITPTFLPPAEEAALLAHIKRMPPASHPRMIDMPYFEPGAATPRGARAERFSFLRQPLGAATPSCDMATFRDQVEQYLNPSLNGPALRDREPSALVQAARADVPRGTLDATRARMRTSILGQRDDRRRARRRRREDLPSIWAVRLASVPDAGIIDISNSGVLLETASKISPGTMLDLQLMGQDVDLTVPARMVRAEVAGVNGLGVRYRLAAAFARELNLLELQPSGGRAITPKALADALARALGEVDRSMPGADGARARFERELRRLLPVRDILIRQNPMINAPGTESIYFTVPYGGGSEHVLQVIFEAGHELSSTEFRLLKAAANLTAAVLELTAADRRKGASD